VKRRKQAEAGLGPNQLVIAFRNLKQTLLATIGWLLFLPCLGDRGFISETDA